MVGIHDLVADVEHPSPSCETHKKTAESLLRSNPFYREA
jgi:hypothetical protein